MTDKEMYLQMKECQREAGKNMARCVLATRRGDLELAEHHRRYVRAFNVMSAQWWRRLKKEVGMN